VIFQETACSIRFDFDRSSLLNATLERNLHYAQLKPWQEALVANKASHHHMKWEYLHIFCGGIVWTAFSFSPLATWHNTGEEKALQQDNA